MRVVLADLKGTGGLVSKDTVAGGYGSRLVPFSKVSAVAAYFKRRYINLPSVQMAYLAAICDRAGHEVVFTRDRLLDGDVALVLSSLIDHRNETAWADRMRARGVRVGFVGLAASKLPELFADHADFVIRGEPEEAVSRLASGEVLQGLCTSKEVMDLDSLPFPRWDLVEVGQRRGIRWSVRPLGGGFPLLSSRSCPEFCTYCPHRILAPYRTRSIKNIVDEIEVLCSTHRKPYLIFRDPLFTEQRERVLEFCEEILARRLHVRFDVETRLDRLDCALLDRAHEAGLRAISYGVESVSPDALKRVGRRPIPEAHHREVIAHCRNLGVLTAAFFVIGFPTDDWQSVAATVDFAIEMDSSFAQFKLLTPYPGTPLYKQVRDRIYEKDWEKFDGFTPTFTHPNLTAEELDFLLGAAYTRFYMRPSYLANLLGIRNERVRGWVHRLDHRASNYTSRLEIAKISRSVTC
jgi:anaerobic magnesium-protoporphyrin IX monomethyl ester cyclase